jgi:hypothetical protein
MSLGGVTNTMKSSGCRRSGSTRRRGGKCWTPLHPASGSSPQTLTHTQLPRASGWPFSCSTWQEGPASMTSAAWSASRTPQLCGQCRTCQLQLWLSRDMRWCSLAPRKSSQRRSVRWHPMIAAVVQLRLALRWMPVVACMEWCRHAALTG